MGVFCSVTDIPGFVFMREVTIGTVIFLRHCEIKQEFLGVTFDFERLEKEQKL